MVRVEFWRLAVVVVRLVAKLLARTAAAHAGIAGTSARVGARVARAPRILRVFYRWEVRRIHFTDQLSDFTDQLSDGPADDPAELRRLPIRQKGLVRCLTICRSLSQRQYPPPSRPGVLVGWVVNSVTQIPRFLWALRVAPFHAPISFTGNGSPPSNGGELIERIQPR